MQLIAHRALLGLAYALLAYSTLIEPYRLDVHTDTVRIPVRAPLSIAHLSDLHSQGYGRLESKVIDALDDAHPDLIAVTGDVVDNGTIEPLRPLFSRMHAPLCVWVVHGNWEDWHPPFEERAFYASVGAHLLVNEGRLVRDDLWVAGVDDPSSGGAHFSAALRGAPRDAAKLALFHAPGAFAWIAPRVDLALAGHTDGGQVRVPFAPPLWLPPGCGNYVEGWYEQGAARLFVSRGLGTSTLPVRFLSTPELEVIHVLPR